MASFASGTTGSADLFSIIRSRRKCAAYMSKAVPKETLHFIAEMAHSAPTGGGHDSREFIIVTERSLLDKLSETHEHSKWLLQAPAALTILGNPQESQYWLEDSCIAGEHIWLAATALGLGASWAAMYQSDDPAESKRREDHVRGVLSIPNYLRPVAVIGLGFPSNNDPPKGVSRKSNLEGILHMNKY